MLFLSLFYYENEDFTLKLPHYAGQSPTPLTPATLCAQLKSPFSFTVARAARGGFLNIFTKIAMTQILMLVIVFPSYYVAGILRALISESTSVSPANKNDVPPVRNLILMALKKTISAC